MSPQVCLHPAQPSHFPLGHPYPSSALASVFSNLPLHSSPRGRAGRRAAGWADKELGQELGKRKIKETITSLQWFILLPCSHNHCIPNFFCKTDPLLACYPPCPPATPQILPIYSYTLSITLLYSPSCPTSRSKERREDTLTAPLYRVLCPPSLPCTRRSQAAEDKVGGKNSNFLGSYRNCNIEQYPPMHPKPRAAPCTCSTLKNLALVFSILEAKSLFIYGSFPINWSRSGLRPRHTILVMFHIAVLILAT